MKFPIPLSWVNRKKTFNNEILQHTKLARVLTTLDLTALGVGSTLGVGVYVLAGQVSKETAGPAVVISFLIAAIASVFAGLCYAEFGARVPRAGSAYVYSYVCVGELVAFIIGWNLILEYVIGAASVARGLSTYIDSLFDNAMAKAFRDAMPIDNDFLSEYPDFFSLAASLIFAGGLALGVKESTTTNNVFTVLNIGIVLYVIITGAFKADAGNWQISKDKLPADGSAGEGGFAPFGINGIIKGAATCFYGFVGFDCVATTGEEAKNPQKAIPISIVISLTIIFLAYFGISTILTMLLPYYLQDAGAPIPHAFSQLNWPVAQWIVSVGAIFGLFASLLGALFPLPRVIYAMSSDGIIFRFLGKVHPRFQTPFLGTVLAGILTGIMSALFDLKHLVDMMSIGTLMAYSIVAACVMLLRYEVDEVEPLLQEKPEKTESSPSRNPFVIFFNLDKQKHPTKSTASLVAWEVLLYFIFSIAITAVIAHAGDSIANVDPLAIAGLCIFGVCLLILVISIALQPQSSRELTFKVPLVPVVPGLSILINIYLMMVLDEQTWIRFGVWMGIGFLIYFGYGVWNSSERKSKKPKSHKEDTGHTNICFDDT